MRIAYVNYGSQSGVTPNVTNALFALGHEVVLQNGALFAPGRPPPFPYVLLLDNTCLLSERQAAIAGPAADIYRDFARSWIDRERETYQRATAIATFSKIVSDSVVDDYGIDAARVHV